MKADIYEKVTAAAATKIGIKPVTLYRYVGPTALKSRPFLCPTVGSERCGFGGDHPTCCKGQKLA